MNKTNNLEELRDATLTADLAKINELIEQGTDVNELLDGMNSLHHACRLHKKDVARVLLEGGADANQRNSDDVSPMFLYMTNYNGESSEEIDIEIFKLLIEHGADVFALFQDNRFDTLRIALTLLGNHKSEGWISRQEYDGEPVLYKITKGAMRFIKPYVEGGPEVWGEMVPIDSQKSIAAKDLGLAGHTQYLWMFELAMYIIEEDLMEFESVENSSQEYMGSACDVGDGDIIRALYNNGIDFSFKTENAITPLLAICKSGRLDGLRTFFQLMPQGYDVNETDLYGYNAAHFLGDMGAHPDMVDELRNHGVDFSAKSTKARDDNFPAGLTPSQVAEGWDDHVMAELLKA